jgi:DeoR family transcriptional regulator of aga operon
MLTGGSLAWAWTFALAGQSTLNFLQNVFFDKVFLSATAVDRELGVTTLEAEEAMVSRTMIQHARQVILVADSSKFGTVSPALICPLSAIHVLVTDTGLPDDVRTSLTAKGLQVACV